MSDPKIQWRSASDLLEEAKQAAVARIDREAEQQRRKHVTPGAGQAMEYQETAAEALAFQSDTDPDPDHYPMLVAEQEAQAAVGMNVSLQEIADQVLAERATWSAAGARIKATRRAAKLLVGAATTKAEIDAVFPIEWPDPGEHTTPT